MITFSQDDPLEGIRARLVNDENMFEWEVALFGPPDTLYQGGYFKAHMKFPRDYPYSPPSVRFVTKVWHPNVYEVSKNSSLWILSYTQFLSEAAFYKQHSRNPGKFKQLD